MAGGVSGWYARLDKVCPDRIEQIDTWLGHWEESLRTNSPIAASIPSTWPTLPAGLLSDPGNVLDQLLARHDADRDGRSPRGAHPTPSRLADSMVAAELSSLISETEPTPITPTFNPAALPPGFIPHLPELKARRQDSALLEEDVEFEEDLVAGRMTRTGIPIPFADLSVGGGLFPARLLRWHADRALRLTPDERIQDTLLLLQSMQLLDICPIAVHGARRRLLLALVRLDLATLEEAKEGCLGVSEVSRVLSDSIRVGDALLDEWPWSTAPRLVMGNPPWLRIKDRFRGHENGAELRKELGHNLRSKVERDGSSRFRTMRGNVNLYRLFIERALDLAEDGGRIRLVVPDSLLREQSSQPLRKLLVEENEWSDAWSFHESARLFTGVTQGILVLGVSRGGETTALECRGPAEPFELCSDGGLEPTVPSYLLGCEDWRNWTDGSWAVPRLPRDHWRREKLLKTIEDLAGQTRLSQQGHWLAGSGRVRVRVGEADQTVHSAGMQQWHFGDDGIPFLRGIHFQNDSEKVWLKHPAFDESIEADAAERQRARWTGILDANTEPRVICQAIVNAQQKRRLRFAVVPSGCVLGNSVNHLQLPIETRTKLMRKHGSLKEGLVWLCELLNDPRLDCWARAWAANNNVNNYEIEGLPLPPAPMPVKARIS